MSQRPRLAGDGRLLVPDEVIEREDGRGYAARHAGRSVDPFEWTADQLLLAESFARLDLVDHDATARWLRTHGMIDRYRIATLKVGRPPVPRVPREGWDVSDPFDVVATFQATVGWLLATLERLSEHRDERDWDPDWGRVVLAGAAEGAILGGPDYAGMHVPPEPSAKDRAEWPADMVIEVEEVRARFVDWPRVHVGEWGSDVYIGADDDREALTVFEVNKRAATLGTTWRDTVELVRLILEPMLRVATERRFATEFEVQDQDGVRREVLVPREMRVWASILEPMYLQAFEALRRITEGIPGAATCRECGRVFLVLDARRRYYCNEKERTRHAHRERRRRLQAGDRGRATDSAPVEKRADPEPER